METKTFEILDSMTFVPMLAVRLNTTCEADRYLVARGGYGISPEDQGRNIVLINLNNARSKSDPYEWGDRTFQVAHLHILQHWNDLEPGDVIDVEYLLGEKPEPKKSEREEILPEAVRKFIDSSSGTVEPGT